MNDTRMSLEELAETQEYRQLTEKQRLWISSYVGSAIEGGEYDPVFATQVAYKCRTSDVARCLSYAVLKNIRIIQVLNLHFKRAPIDAFLIEIERAIRNKRITAAQVQALKLKCKALGIAARLPEQPKAVKPKKKRTPRPPKPKKLEPVSEPSKSPYGNW